MRKCRVWCPEDEEDEREKTTTKKREEDEDEADEEQEEEEDEEEEDEEEEEEVIELLNYTHGLNAMSAHRAVKLFGGKPMGREKQATLASCHCAVQDRLPQTATSPQN